MFCCRIEYYLTTQDIASRNIRLNGHDLVLDIDGQIPLLPGLTIQSDTVISSPMLPPTSISFIVYPDANAMACVA